MNAIDIKVYRYSSNPEIILRIAFPTTVAGLRRWLAVLRIAWTVFKLLRP